MGDATKQATHTPGPWTTTTTHRGEMGLAVHTADSAPIEHQICQVARWPLEADEANARLIAAAPELLDAAEAYLAAIEVAIEKGYAPPTLLTDDPDHPDGTQMLRAAIAKAKGGHR